jgi:hypothetical protein
MKKAEESALQKQWPELKGYPIIDETTDQKRGLITRTTQHPSTLSHLILSAPHFYVGSPFMKQPNDGCKSKGDYTTIDLLNIPQNFLPRAVFNLKNSSSRGLIVNTEGLKQNVKNFRLAWRNWVSASNERTFITTIIPPEVLHVNKVFSMSFPNLNDLVLFAGLSFSIVYDFFVRVTGVDHIWNDDVLSLPFPESLDETLKLFITDRTLKLVCITEHYAPLWKACSIDQSSWEQERMLLSHKARRAALVELDVLAAMTLNLDLSSLLLLYSTQFPTFHENESETYYDRKGRIVFTYSKGLPGVGFSRPEWEQIKDKKIGTVERKVMDDTLPSGPRERTIVYQAPFDRCDREQDYEIVWSEFERRLGKKREVA